VKWVGIETLQRKKKRDTFVVRHRKGSNKGFLKKKKGREEVTFREKDPYH